MKFEDTYLSDDILDALYDMRFVECTPIQEKCIPEILNYYDIIGVAQTGTGKTAAYLLPILSLLSEGNYPSDHINCVIMSPTRELAQQIDNAMQGFSYYLDNISSVAVYGGNDGNRYDQETKGLRMGASIVIATPGRLLSHIRTGNVDLSKVSFFVLDEADRMLDMGFYDDIMQIVKQLPDDRQTIMFSATMPPKIQTMARALLHNHKEINIAISKPADKIAQSAFICYEEQKVGLIKHFAKNSQLDRTIIFCGKKERVKVINRELKRASINCLEMHSDLTQQERDDVMYKFKGHIADVLVATDIVARGIDIDDIKTVINFDVPNDVEDYVHRIGRTARAENSGCSITLVSPNDMYKFHEIETFLGKEIQKDTMPAELGEVPEYKIENKKAKRPSRKRKWSHKRPQGKSKPAKKEKSKNSKQ